MTDLTFQFDDAHEFSAKLSAATGVVETEMVAATNRLTLQGERYAKQFAPVKTGHLRRSIAAEPATFGGGTVTGRYGTATPYARYVEYGRGPVVARGRALRLVIGGRVIFAKRVGPARGRFFMRASLNALRPRIAPEFRGALSRIIASIRGGG